MILSRVIKHVKEQNWTAVFLDFVIVVAGILIAFQITEWNDARRERTLEHEYLERIYTDLEATLAPQEDTETWNETRIAQQALILNALRSGVLRDEDRQAFETGLALFGFVGGPEIRWATVEELRSTGAMNIIRDVSLRSMILRTDSALKRRQGIDDNFMQSIYAYREEIGGRFGVAGFTGQRDAISLNYDFDALAADPGFINALSQIDFLARFKRDNFNTQLDDVRALRNELAKRLEPQGDATP